MAIFQVVPLGDTAYFHFAAHDREGSASDGTNPAFAVRLCGESADAAPIISGSAALLTHTSFPNGIYEVAIPVTTGNGFIAGNTYMVTATLTVDGETPAGILGAFRVIEANATPTLITSTKNIASAIWDSETAQYTAQGTFGRALGTTIQSTLADITSATTTALNRLGAWTGTGVNTVLGAMRAIANKLAQNVPDLTADGLTFDPSTDSLEALRDRGDVAWTTPTQEHIRDAMKKAPSPGNPDQGSIDDLILNIDKPFGAYQCSLFVKTDDDIPVNNARVTIHSAAEYNAKYTDATGKVIFGLEAGQTYTAIISPGRGYFANNPYTVVTNNNGVIVTPANGVLTVTAVSIPEPTNSDTILLYNFETEFEEGLPFSPNAMTINFTHLTMGARRAAEANAILNIMEKNIKTSENGLWATSIPKSAVLAMGTITMERVYKSAKGDTITEIQVARLDPKHVNPAGQLCWADLDIVSKSIVKS